MSLYCSYTLLLHSYLVFVDYVIITLCFVFFFFKQKTAYEMRISDWSSDVCSSDLARPARADLTPAPTLPPSHDRSSLRQEAHRDARRLHGGFGDRKSVV